MIIKSIRLTNFRSVLDGTLNCGSLTALVGPNGSGKSAFLRGLELFYSASPVVNKDDFYNRESKNDIEIAITFGDLTPQEKARFDTHMSGDDLSVVRVFTEAGGKDSGKYYGFRMQNSDLAHIRVLSGRDYLNAYKGLRERTEYAALPSVRSQADAEEALETWEIANPKRLKSGRDDGQFFGFTNVGRGYLGDLTRFLFIPAVRDAAEDALEGRSSAITMLMDLVVRASLSSRSEIAGLKQEMQERYDALTDPAKLAELGNLETRLTGTLQQYYGGTSVSLNWLPAEQINLPSPKAEVRLVEDRFDVPVARTGHGLQRAFILALLQHLAVARAAKVSEKVDADKEGEEEYEEPPPLNLILGIEEPELYQHPSRQRHFAQVLYDLAHGKIPGVASRTQIIYATHSALMVGIDRFNQVRRVKRLEAEPGAPKVTTVVGTSWDRVAERVWVADGSPGQQYTGETIRPRVATLMTPWMNEGFFADVAVLVEGEDDRAAILGAAQARGCDLESSGCTVIPCGGKTNIDRPTIIFNELGIATYAVWDSDKGKFEGDVKKSGNCLKENRRLLRIHGVSEEDWPATVSDRYACFEVDLETTTKTQIGPELFEELLGKQQQTFVI